MYADDTRLHIEGDVINAYVKMSEDLYRIAHWAHLRQLKLNAKKCGILHVGLNNPLHSYILQNTKLCVVTSMTDLGVVANDKPAF